jgi:hypothetical protein
VGAGAAEHTGVKQSMPWYTYPAAIYALPTCLIEANKPGVHVMLISSKVRCRDRHNVQWM